MRPNLVDMLALTNPTPFSRSRRRKNAYETDLKEPGGSYLLSLVNRWRASWALVRQWAGLDAAIAAREVQIKDSARSV